MNHLFVTQDYPPDLGGMARRHVELCRRFGEGSTKMEVSTVSADGSDAFDSREPYRIDRQPFTFAEAKIFVNQLRWGWWLREAVRTRVQVLHCGNIRPCGYAVYFAHATRHAPYLLYVNGGDLLREQSGIVSSPRKAFTAKQILSGARGVVATSTWVATLASDVIQQLRIKQPPRIAAIDLGTDPNFFHPGRDTHRLRSQWKLDRQPLLITVARLVPHKGQDTVLRALSVLRHEFPNLHYAIVGSGPDEPRLARLAHELGVSDRTIFASALADDEVAEAYATATIYVGLSRVERAIDAEGFGISFLEAAASELPIVAGDSGGVRSAVRDAENGVVVAPLDVTAVAAAIRTLLVNDDLRRSMASVGRRLVETHYNWDRVARETRNFTYEVLSSTDVSEVALSPSPSPSRARS